MSGDSPWQDKRLLYELYHGDGLNKSKIADQLGCSDVTVGNWMSRFGIPTARAYERKAFLEHLYKSRGLSQSQIGEMFGIHQTAVSRLVKKHGIKPNSKRDYHEPSIYFSESGYLTCRHRVGGRDEGRVAFRIHRLVAVAEYGFDAVSGNDIHHTNNHRCDNRPSNLEPISRSEHATLHHDQGDILG